MLPMQRIPNAYGALRILSIHPAMDARRIALTVSRGGIVTTLSATVWAHDTLVTLVAAGQPGFRAFIALYPHCNWTMPEMAHLSSPLQIHAGARDDGAPAKPCENMVAALRSVGAG
jgi:dienelactone hydrolase